MKTNSLLISYIRTHFNARIEEKNSWGKNEVKALFERAVADGTLSYLDHSTPAEVSNEN